MTWLGLLLGFDLCVDDLVGFAVSQVLTCVLMTWLGLLLVRF